MGYISENLMEGEQVVYEGRLSVWALTKWLLPGVLMVPFLFVNQWWGTTVFVLGVGMMTAALIQLATTEMAVTTERVIAKRGWIARRTTEISLSRVEGVEVNQTIQQRLLNYGHILVSGVGSHKAQIRDVQNPLGFRKAFLIALEESEGITRGKQDGKVDSTRSVVESSVQQDHQASAEIVRAADAGGDPGDFESELSQIVTLAHGGWVAVSKEELLAFVQRWQSKDARALTLVGLNEHADVLKALKASQG